MRVIGYIPHSLFKITVFSWNEKYIVKIEVGYYEQHYKFPSGAIEKWEDLIEIFDNEFMLSVQEKFVKMAEESKAAHKRWKKNTQKKNAP